MQPNNDSKNANLLGQWVKGVVGLVWEGRPLSLDRHKDPMVSPLLNLLEKNQRSANYRGVLPLVELLGHIPPCLHPEIYAHNTVRAEKQLWY